MLLGLSAVAVAALTTVRAGKAQDFRSNQEARVAADDQEREERQGRGGGPQSANASAPEALKFRYMGPAPAGRISAVVGVPGDANIYYLGNASGGVWKTTDGGATFKPIFDDQPSQAIGALAVADSDPNQVWVGTGESWIIRYVDVMGDGVYKSNDGGATWKHMGLDATGRIARVLVHPTNPNLVYVCAVGRATGPQQERGVFKTTDGGETWKQTLFVNPDTGCSGLTLDPKNPQHMFAGAWQIEMHTWGQFTGNKPGSGIYESNDGGDTWKKVTAPGLPHDPLGKIDIQIAPSNGKIVYALIQTKDQGSMWRSDDGGANWQVTSWDRSLTGRAGYYIRIAVNPFNENDVLVSSSSHHRSIDGGKTFSGNGGGLQNPGPISCGDCHDIWMDNKIEGRYALTDDGGASLAHGKGAATRNVDLPNGQMYHIATDNRVPYWIYSNRQDDGTMRGPATVAEQTANGVLPDGMSMNEFGRAGGAAPAAGRGGRGGGGAGFGGRGGAQLAWQPNIGGCESGFTIPDKKDPDIVWATCYGNKVTRWNARTNTPHSVEPWLITLDSEPNVAKYRCHWTAPIAIDPFDSKNVFYGCQLIFKTVNDGKTWVEFSSDLSTKDPKYIVSNGGLVGDNLGQYDGEVVWSMAFSPVVRGVMWAGTNDGKLWITKGANLPKAVWTDLTKNVTGLPAWSTIAQISPSNFDGGTAYIAVNKHLMDDRKPYIFKTTDYGVTWKNITGNLPSGHNLDYVLTVTENPNKKGMLFAGTGHGFFYSMDDGQTWTRFMNGLPNGVSVSWIEVQKNFHDVAISTYGRGLWILPNISALEQTGQTQYPTSETKLFAPNPVYRMARSAYTQPGRPHFTFSLAKDPAGPVKLEVLDAAGKVIRTLSVNAKAGLNSANWDLRYEAPLLVALKTTPPDNPHIWEEPRFQNQDTRRITHWGITGQTGIPMAAPGKYQVRLSVDGQTFTEPFTVVKDPAIVASEDDLVKSTQLQVRLRDDITKTSEMVNQLELWRKQIEDMKKAKSGDSGAVNVLGELDKVLWDTENQLVSRSEIHSDDKYFPEAYKVYMNLIWLSGAVGQGASDEAGGVDWLPTDVQYQVTTMIEGQIAKAQLEVDKFKATTIPAFNAANGAKGLIIK